MPRKALSGRAAEVERAGYALYAWVVTQLRMLQRLRESNDFERINGMLLYVDKSVKL